MTDFPKNGSSFVVETIDRTEYRWARYKPQGAKQMGKPGRWQKRVWHGDFFKWENCEEPSGEIAPLSEDGPISAAFKGQTARSEALEAEVKRLREALENSLRVYIELANSGDCGFWNPEEEAHVKQARAALEGKE